MNKEEEVKQYLRNQINSCILIQDDDFKNIFYLYYNKNYLRALKLSKITGKPVYIENIKGGEVMFWFNIEKQIFIYYPKIFIYLNENYSSKYHKRIIITEEVLNEYPKYKNYKHK